MSKEFFYSIGFRNVSGGNILQNRIALKPCYTMQKLMNVSFGAKGKSPGNDCKQRLKYGCQEQKK